MTDWTTADIPSLSGKTAVVTGATGGLGYETAMALAGAGAIVILTGRNDAKGLRAIEGICERFPNALIAYEHLDLASLPPSPILPGVSPPATTSSISSSTMPA